jgi:hypothetical protein
MSLALQRWLGIMATVPADVHCPVRLRSNHPSMTTTVRGRVHSREQTFAANTIELERVSQRIGA